MDENNENILIEDSNTNVDGPKDQKESMTESPEQHLARKSLDIDNDSDQPNPARDSESPSVDTTKIIDDKELSVKKMEKTAADPDLKFEDEKVDITAYFLYYGEPWNGTYYYKVTRRVDDFAVEAGDSVAVKGLIGLHTVLFIIRNKQYNKVLLADPPMKSVLEVKFSEVTSIEGKVSKSQQTQLDDLFKTYCEAKKRKVSPTKPALKEVEHLTKKALRTQPVRSSKSSLVIKKEPKTEKPPIKEKQKEKKPSKPQRAKILKKQHSSVSSESEDEVIQSKAKPANTIPAKTAPKPANGLEAMPTSVVPTSAILNSSISTTEPSPMVVSDNKSKVSTYLQPALPVNSPIQSLLDLQQLHHRQALAQQQLNFMVLFQQQQQAESDTAFRNIMQSLQQQQHPDK